jgi:hypothetical protein
MTRSRPAIAAALKSKLLYDSAYVCAVCQDSGVHIHHVDENPANNNPSNLIVVCSKHHDEAHTRRQLSQNLTPSALKDAKANWEGTVRTKRQQQATLRGQVDSVGRDSFFAVGIAWGYINHKRVAQMLSPSILASVDQSLFAICQQRQLVDQHGILIKPADAPQADSYIHGSVYDWFEFGDDSRLHRLYSEFVDQISLAARPVHLSSMAWSRSEAESLVEPGGFIFAVRAFHFKAVSETQSNEHRQVHASARSLAVEFFIDTEDMFGTTSMTVSFSGRQVCAALLHVKSKDSGAGGSMTLRCTPIALGVSFQRN